MSIQKRYLLILAVVNLILLLWGIHAYLNRRAEALSNFHFETAKKYKDQGKLDKAESEFQEATRINPKNWRAYYELGQIDKGNKKFDSAIQQFSNCTSINPRFPDVYLELSKCLNTNKDYNHAYSVISTYISLKPKDPDGYYARGLLYAGQFQWQKVIADYQSAVALDTSSWKYIYWLGRAYTSNHEYSSAVSTLLKADQLAKKEDTVALVDAAMVYVYQHAETHDPKLVVECEKLIKTAVERNPQYPPAYAIMALMYRDTKEYQKAISLYKKCFQVILPSESKYPQVAYYHVDYGQTLFRLGKRKEAIQELEKALEIMPNNEEALAFLGHIYFEDKEYEKAFELYQTCLKADPAYFYVHEYLAQYYHYAKHDDVKANEEWNLFCQSSTHIPVPHQH